jgi:hypothetical protein
LRCQNGKREIQLGGRAYAICEMAE